MNLILILTQGIGMKLLDEKLVNDLSDLPEYPFVGTYHGMVERYHTSITHDEKHIFNLSYNELLFNLKRIINEQEV
jgi:hypothetical protein